MDLIIAQTSPVGWDDIRAILPALVLLATGTIVLMVDLVLRGWTEPTKPGEKSVLHFISLLGTVLAGALVCATLAAEDGGAKQYFLDAVVVDRFSMAMSLVVVLGTFLCLLGAMDALERRDLVHGEFHCLVLFASAAMVLFTQSTSLILLFLSLETLSMSVFVLTAYTRESKGSVEGALKYFVLSGFSSAFLLFGLVLVYGATREMNLARIAAVLNTPDASVDTALLLAGVGLTLIGLCFKVGAFPFHSWLPDAYEGAPTVVTGFMAVTVKAATFAVFLRLVSVLLETTDTEVAQRIQQAGITALSVVAVLTMIFGNVVAVAQTSVKRMLAYSAIAHTGYLLIGVIASIGSHGSPDAQAPAAVLFYLLPYSLMTAGAFTIISYLGQGDRDLETFADYRGLAQAHPFSALGLLILMVSFAGIPPTAGFWGKLYVFQQAVQAGHWALALVGIITSIISVYYYLRLVVNMYMHPLEPTPPIEEKNQTASGVVVAFTAVAVILLGLLPDHFLRLSATFALW